MSYPQGEQEIYDCVMDFLWKQNKPSVNPYYDACMYRDGIGNKCAIGCLIPDDLYDAKMEGSNLRQLLIHYFSSIEKNDAMLELENFLSNHRDFLIILQTLHDQYYVDTCGAFRDYLIIESDRFATAFDLVPHYFPVTGV